MFILQTGMNWVRPGSTSFLQPDWTSRSLPFQEQHTHTCCKTYVLVYFLILPDHPENVGWDKRSRYSDLLWVGRPGDQIPVGARFSTPAQTGPGAHLASYPMSTGSLPGGATAWAWHWPPTPFWAFVVCSGVTFTLYFYCLENEKCSLYQNSLWAPSTYNVGKTWEPKLCITHKPPKLEGKNICIIRFKNSL